MKEIVDIVVLVIFVFLLISFIVGFNKQQIEKHINKLDKNEKKKENEDDKTTTN